MDKGNVDKHRYSMSGIKAVEEGKHGRSLARARYGALDYENSPPPKPADQSRPERAGDKDNLQGPGYDNSVPEKSWLRGGGKGGAGYPGYVPGYRGKR